jgi:hypothetical protein
MENKMEFVMVNFEVGNFPQLLNDLVRLVLGNVSGFIL